MKDSHPTKPLIVVVTGPSGSGQTSVADGLLKKRTKLKLVKGTTTRLPKKRKGGDHDHNFVTRAEFTTTKNAGGFLETDYYVGEYYGTRKIDIDRIVKAKKIPLLTLTPKGYLQIRHIGAYKICSLFIDVENISVLKDRITSRQPDITKVKLDARLSAARIVRQQKTKYDHIIINRQGQLNAAIKRASAYVDRCKQAR